MRRSLSSFDFYNFTTSTVESCITTPLCFDREKTSVSHFQYGHTTFMLKDTENYVLSVIHMSRQVICFFLYQRIEFLRVLLEILSIWHQKHYDFLMALNLFRAQCLNVSVNANGYCSLVVNCRLEAIIVWPRTLQKLLLSTRMPPLADETLCHRMLRRNTAATLR